MDISNLFDLLCGISLFMFGMAFMGDGLKRVAGSKLETLLAKLTNTPLKGILLGTGVTAVIQSSSATSVMTVGFVNSGMMKFRQAIGIIMGAILGTSITGWVIVLSSLEGGSGIAALLSTATMMGIVAVAGILLRTFSKRRSNVGDIMLGFVVLMVGIDLMSSSVAPLSQSEKFVSILTMFSNPLLGILVGAAFTAVLQSASASVGILQTLTATGVITFSTAFPILLGISIGAAVPVLLTALAASVEGKRTSCVYLLINVLGVVVVGSMFYIINASTGGFSFMSITMSKVSIAAVNTLYRLVVIIVLFPFIGLIEKFTCFIIKDKTAEEPDEQLLPLEERFLPYPPLAISQSKSAIFDMAKKAVKSVYCCFEALNNYSTEMFEKTAKYEKLADRYENDIGTYLMRISRRSLTKEQNADVFKYLHTLADFERITDRAMNIAFIARDNHEENIIYSEQAGKELDVITSAVREALDLTIEAYTQEDWKSDGRIVALTASIHNLCGAAELNHVKRLQAGECSLRQGAGFGELLTNLERMAVHCSKIIRALQEVNPNSYGIHAANAIKASLKDNNEGKAFEEYSAKYVI
ncbi:phosphate:Na+ symporter [Ruminococcus sp. YE71]|uniref:Na/Pi cotransporter family protein n=1 Tax=unclassified Ruminococcus TaxID=2608920 RepID=UPI00088EBB7F|nr:MULTISPECIES: Na/Pi cotransporter family protein [unclassified Ruminococcus]SDA18499.1 phosphate:Na+ symporter [Ruminococcus sp. YE78]SFW29832.1 phosphate:Na+ symporter [Ruminococcus sp. YE71]